MSITETKKFSECVLLAKKAKSLRDAGLKDNADKFEKQAVQEFRILISDTRKFLNKQAFSLQKFTD